MLVSYISFFFFFNDTATTEIYTLSLHDALPISCPTVISDLCRLFASSMSIATALFMPASTTSRHANGFRPNCFGSKRSEEHTSELQSQSNLVCRLLLEKKKQRSDHIQ